jgi:putative inorganic carbon (HCO3(-)) transporter
MASTTPSSDLDTSRSPPAASGRISSQFGSLPQVPPAAIITTAILAALICGRFFADGRIKYAAGLVLAAVYAPLAFFDLPAAFAVFAAILFIKDIRALSVGPNAIGVLVGLGFIGAFAARFRTMPVLKEQRRLIIGLVLFMLLLTVSIAWAPQPGTAASEAGFWWLGALAMLIVMTTPTTARGIGLIALAFVIGATLAAVYGLASGGLAATAASASTVGTTTQTAVNGRLTGGGGDPNLQAAGFIAAMFLAMGLFNVYRRRVARIALIVAFALITIAFFATESRGGLLALGVSTTSALVLFPHHRRRLLGFVAIALVVAGIAVASQPGSLSRITDFGGGTSGRSDIWAVATKVFEQHPLFGVGLNNFAIVEPRYTLLHKNISRIGYITGTAGVPPYPAHNTYLQLLAENGIVGLAAYLAILIASLRTAWLAVRAFRRKGYRDYAYLAQTSMMGTIGMLTAIFFFTDGDDWRVWILLGLGPALLALARSLPGVPAAPTRPKPSSALVSRT